MKFMSGTFEVENIFKFKLVQNLIKINLFISVYIKSI